MKKAAVLAAAAALCLGLGSGPALASGSEPEPTPAIPAVAQFLDPSTWVGCDEMGGVVTPGELPQADAAGSEIPDMSSWEPGFHRADGWLYYVGDDGQLLRSGSTGVWDFDENGRYTTGLPELDETIRDILLDIGADEMSQYRALIYAFLYTTGDHQYIKHDLEDYDFQDSVDWTASRALVFFKNGGGVCYDYASAFCVLARALGYEAFNVVGSVFSQEHGYVCIPQGELLALYDPELASIEPDLYPDLTLFQFLDQGDYGCYFWQ